MRYKVLAGVGFFALGVALWLPYSLINKVKTELPVSVGPNPSRKSADRASEDAELAKLLKDRFDAVEQDFAAETSSFDLDSDVKLELVNNNALEWWVRAARLSLQARLALTDDPTARIALLNPLLERTKKLEKKCGDPVRIETWLNAFRLEVEIEILKAKRKAVSPCAS